MHVLKPFLERVLCSCINWSVWGFFSQMLPSGWSSMKLDSTGEQWETARLLSRVFRGPWTWLPSSTRTFLSWTWPTFWFTMAFILMPLSCSFKLWPSIALRWGFIFLCSYMYCVGVTQIQSPICISLGGHKKISCFVFQSKFAYFERA